MYMYIEGRHTGTNHFCSDQQLLTMLLCKCSSSSSSPWKDITQERFSFIRHHVVHVCVYLLSTRCYLTLHIGNKAFSLHIASDQISEVWKWDECRLLLSKWWQFWLQECLNVIHREHMTPTVWNLSR